MRTTILALTLAVVTLPGCMMVREGKVRPPAPWPPQQTLAKKSIGVTVAGTRNPNGAHQMPRTEAIEAAQKQAVKAYTESGLFSSVVATEEPTDLRADVTVVEDGSKGMGVSGYLSALTFTMIPGYVSEDLVLSTNFTDREKKIADNVEMKEELGFWIQFFLLFTMPFTDSTSTVTESTLYDMHRVTIQEAHSRGIF
ncbi:MAG TPA: hypothetical protein VIU63_05235 [Nitrospira sp.]